MWRTECAEQRRKYDREYYAKRTEEGRIHSRLTQAKRRAAIRRAIEGYKLKNPCACGESHPACLDFHHHNKDKEFCIGAVTNKGWGLDRIMKEIKKCSVMCANCHRKLHWLERQSFADTQSSKSGSEPDD